MKKSILVGLTAGTLIGGLQLVVMLCNLTGAIGGIVYYLPMLIYFAGIYTSIKQTRDNAGGAIGFKDGLKAGGLTALISCLMWGIAFFIGLTHQDVYAFIHYKVANHQENEIRSYLGAFTRQNMFDMSKFWVIPNFLLGFVITVMATIFLLKRKKA